MSSKDSSDSVSSKSKKKDKEKKESKKEKKEKSKKKDSKNLEKDTVGDENQTERNNQESPSPKTKKTFGIFRRSGRKSKGTKHGSSDSLKRESRDSADFDRSGSEFSLESSESMGSAAAETSQPSEKIVLEKESAKANLQDSSKASNKTGLERTDLAESTEVVLPDMAEDGCIVKTGAVNKDGNEPSPKQDSVDHELEKEVSRESIEKPEKIQEQNTSPENTEAQPLKPEPQSSIILTAPNKDINDSSTKREKEEQNERVTLTSQENASSRAEGASQVVSQESACSYEVALEDIKKVHDREITSSEDESVDTVVSIGISDTTNVTREVREGVEIGTVNQEDVGEEIISTYKERPVPPLDDFKDPGNVQNEAPMNVEEMSLVYPDKHQVQDQNAQQTDPVSEEIPVVLAVSKNQERAIPMLEEDASSIFAKTAHDNEVHDREMSNSDECQTLKQADVEESIISTYKERKVPPQDDSREPRVQEEAPVNEDAILLVYPDKEQVHDVNERQDDPVDEEITRSEKKSIDTVVSTGISISAYTAGEMREEVEIGTRNQADVEESIISTYKERKVPPQDDSREPRVQEEAPVNEDAILLVYPDKEQVHDVNERQDDPVDEEITRSEKKSIDTVVSTGISSSAYTAGEMREEVEIGTRNQEDVEEPIKSVYKDRKVPRKDEPQDQQVKEEAPLNEEAILLVYPDQKYYQNERQNGAVDEEKLVVEAVTTNKENQLQKQVEEFLKLDADIKERSNHENESNVEIVKREIKENTGSDIEENKGEQMPKKGIVDDRPQKFTSESFPFDEETRFTSSTPKRPSLDNKRETTKEIKNEEHKNMKPANDKSATTSYKTSSVVHEFQFRIQFVNAIKDVKMSSSVLLAQLAEINKKLRELRQELLKLLEKDRE